MRFLQDISRSLFFLSRWRGPAQNPVESSIYSAAELENAGQKTGKSVDFLNVKTAEGKELMDAVTALGSKSSENEIASVEAGARTFLNKTDALLARNEIPKIQNTLKSTSIDQAVLTRFTDALTTFRAFLKELYTKLVEKIAGIQKTFQERVRTIQTSVQSRLDIFDKRLFPSPGLDSKEAKIPKKYLEEIIASPDVKNKLPGLAAECDPKAFKGGNQWNEGVLKLFPPDTNIQEVQRIVGTKLDGKFGPHSLLSLLLFAGLAKEGQEYAHKIDAWKAGFRARFDSASDAEAAYKSNVLKVDPGVDKDKNPTGKPAYKFLKEAVHDQMAAQFTDASAPLVGDILQQGGSFIFTLKLNNRVFKISKDMDAAQDDTACLVYEVYSTENLRTKQYLGLHTEPKSMAEALKKAPEPRSIPSELPKQSDPKPISNPDASKRDHVEKGETIGDAIIDSNMTREQALADVSKKCPREILDNQALVDVTYISFDGKYHRGQLVVDKRLQSDVEEVFQVMLDTKFPIHKVIPITKYGWSDDASMKDNNTSGFNYRTIAGGEKLSNHAKGFSIDINPLQNPEVQNGKNNPPTGKYEKNTPGTLTADHPVVQKFKELGWTWGGTWESKQDYQHFEKPLKKTSGK